MKMMITENHVTSSLWTWHKNPLPPQLNSAYHHKKGRTPENTSTVLQVLSRWYNELEKSDKADSWLLPIQCQ